jgi:meso-butanediol dehydrogenase / (S,S)-butanediol dehydrogenase / diacetyl reductase
MHGKVVLVTGAASGIGLATAIRLARAGARVLLADVDDAAGEAAAQVAAATAPARFIHLDVSDEAGWRAVTTQIQAREGRLDGLVNNAGVLRMGPLQQTSIEDWQLLSRINLDGPFLGTQCCLPLIAGSGGGAIVNVVSTHALVGAPLEGAYAALKAAVRAFTRSVAIECAQSRNNVRVNSVLPGPIRTRVLENMPPAMRAALGPMEAVLVNVASRVPMGRLGEADEIAAGIAFLLSGDASYVTGADLVIDGGMSA